MTTGGGSFWTSGSVPLIEPKFLESIISAASDIALVIASDGRILSVLVNSNDDSFGNLSHWEGRALVDFLTSESTEKFRDAHKAYLDGRSQLRPMELNHSDNAVWQYPVRYSFHRFGNDGEALLLGRDLRPIAETQQQLVRAQIAMEQGYEARREFDTRYRAILGHVRDAVVFVSIGTGRVDDANERAAELLGLKPEALQGANFAGLFQGGSAMELTENLMTATLADVVRPVEVVAARSRTPLEVHPTLFRAGSQRILMCRLVPENEDAGASVPPGPVEYANALFRLGTDAMLFTDAEGHVLFANDAFLDLVGAVRSSEVAGRSFADYMSRGQIDLTLMLGSTERPGQMKVYAARLVNALGTKIATEISLTRLENPESPTYGLVIRDANRLESVRGAASDGAALPDQGQKVVELVGSATMKEIVAETADVVERMCIETAVNLTRNNRVAAAEMLGLSRQSLYVKLRKYGLLNKNG